MANQYVNKVIIGKEVKLDLTADSVTPDKLAKGITAHDKTGHHPGRGGLHVLLRGHEAPGQERDPDL